MCNLDIIKVLTFTWNVGNATPDPLELEHWCPQGGDEYDIIAVGTQENQFKVEKANKGKTTEVDVGDDASGLYDIDDEEEVENIGEIETTDINLNDKGAKAPQLHEGGARRAEKRTMWEDMVQERLGKDYAVVQHVVLWEMRLTIYARAKLVKGHGACIFNVESASSATGVAGVLGNKGGLMVKLNVGCTSLVFVSCHLAAHSHKLEQRNENCQQILRETSSAIGTKQLDAALEFDHIFWMGDLNYRIDLVANNGCSGLTEQEHLVQVKQIIDKKDWEGLMAADQLKATQRESSALVGFVEGVYDFAPTFKVKRVVDTVHKDQRIPSYCDRVLWKSMPSATPIKQTMLKSLPGVSTSDHKPILSAFEITPSAGITMSNNGAVIQFSDVCIRGLSSGDVTGGSDPYLIFFTNPPEVLGSISEAPISKVKKIYGADCAVGAIATGIDQVAATLKTSISSICTENKSASRAAASENGSVQWSERELPLLHAHVAPTDLNKITLIIAIVDHDLVGSDDLLGTVLVSLSDPSQGTVGRYEIHIDEPVVLYGASKNKGWFKGTLTVITDGVDDATKQAQEKHVGLEASSIHLKDASCGCSIM